MYKFQIHFVNNAANWSTKTECVLKHFNIEKFTNRVRWNEDPGTHISPGHCYPILEETWWQDLRSRNCNQKILGGGLYGPSKEISSSSWQITGIRNSFRGLTTLPVFHRRPPRETNRPIWRSGSRTNDPTSGVSASLRIETYPSRILSVNGAVFHPLPIQPPRYIVRCR